MLVYKIRDKISGLFKCKRTRLGLASSWNATGDIYRTIGIAKSALKNSNANINDLEIIGYILTEVSKHDPR